MQSIDNALVAMATFHRPQRLGPLLSEILAQADQVEASTGIRFQVLVVDNDPGESGKTAVLAVGDARIHYIVEPHPGISAARNRIIEEAISGHDDVVIFIDDDEMPHTQWLAQLLQTYASTDCVAVAGPVHAVFEDHEPDPWIQASGAHLEAHRSGLRTGDVITRAATNNLLLDVSAVDRLDLRFDDRFGLSGGEDSLFTGRLTASGARIVWCAEAIVDDLVPTARNNRAFSLRRRRMQSSTTVQVDLLLSCHTALARIGCRLRWSVVGAGQLVKGTGLAAWGLLRRDLALTARGERRAMSGIGVFIGCLGLAGVSYGEGRR